MTFTDTARRTAKLAPSCPQCTGSSLRDVNPQGLTSLDCTCTACGWHFMSPARRLVLRVLVRQL